MDNELQQNLKHNYVVNVLDGGFFGAALGFASFTTILPLFVSNMTDSAILIGLIPAIHSVGWQLPQLLTARHVSNLRQFKPAVLFFTIHERLPFFGLAFLALFLPKLGLSLALPITFLLLIWQGLGGGFTANAWQSMIGKVIPADILATFYGSQSAAANFLSSAGAIIAGVMIQSIASPYNYSLCFFIASALMAISWFFISRTREPVHLAPPTPEIVVPFWQQVRAILHKDHHFRWFLVTRMLIQFSMMSYSFYTVYAVRRLGMTATTAGILTSVLLVTEVVANPLLGHLADRTGHRAILEMGAMAAIASSLLASLTSSVFWFYIVIILEGISMATFWTITLAMTMEYGSDQEKPIYIGLANTMIAPATFLAPLIGGWLADTISYQFTFFTSAGAGLITALVLRFLVKNPKENQKALYLTED